MNYVLKIMIILFSSILISSCAYNYVPPKEKLENALNSYTGLTEEQLVSTIGIPTKFYETGNTKILTYFYDYGSSYSTSNNNWARDLCQGRYCVDVPYRESTVENRWYCEITFRFNAGVMAQWSYKGNSCY
jgi:hypothetical protein